MELYIYGMNYKLPIYNLPQVFLYMYIHNIILI